MKVYKINKREMIGAILLMILFSTLIFLSIYLREDYPFASGVCAGGFTIWFAAQFTGIIKINREKEPIETVYIDDEV